MCSFGYLPNESDLLNPSIKFHFSSQHRCIIQTTRTSLKERTKELRFFFLYKSNTLNFTRVSLDSAARMFKGVDFAKDFFFDAKMSSSNAIWFYSKHTHYLAHPLTYNQPRPNREESNKRLEDADGVLQHSFAVKVIFFLLPQAWSVM